MNKADLDKRDKIYQVVRLIPVGKVASYGQIADLAGLPGRARLVGKYLSGVSAQTALSVPWYRVLRSSGQIAFAFGSDSFNEQRHLLVEEGVFCKGRTVNMKQYQWQPELADLLFQLDY